MERGLELESPIAVLSTPRGQGAIGVVKLSGRDLIPKISSLFSASDRLFLNPRKMIYGFFFDNCGGMLDEVMLVFFPAPASYTGEDVIEVSFHGNMNIAQSIIEILLVSNFELALPGEFTYRAVMNGKMDFIKAEAVHELVTSKSSFGCRFALTRLTGKLTVFCEQIYARIVEMSSWLRMHLDYSEDEVEKLPYFNISEILKKLQTLIQDSQNMQKWQEGAKVVLTGAPNVGKSSFFNLLVGHQRALISDIAGTTRDYLEEEIELLGHPIHIFDTAGIRKSDDTIEKMGINLGLSLLETADLILCFLDPDNQQIPEDVMLYKGKLLLIMNKSDLGYTVTEDVMAISVFQRHNIDKLVQRIVERLDFPTLDQERSQLMLGSLRQKQLCEKTYYHLLKVQEFQTCGDLDIVSFHLQKSANYIAQLLGRVTDTDINGSMFSRFCLGK